MAQTSPTISSCYVSGITNKRPKPKQKKSESPELSGILESGIQAYWGIPSQQYPWGIPGGSNTPAIPLADLPCLNT